MDNRDVSRSRYIPAVVAVVSAGLAASCCLVPLALIATGIAGASLMMATMRYEWLTLPMGVLGLFGAYAAYASYGRRCAAAGCRFVGRRMARGVLALATLVVVAALMLRLFPSWTAALIGHQH